MQYRGLGMKFNLLFVLFTFLAQRNRTESARRFDKPFAFSGTPSMNDTGCKTNREHRAMS